MSERFIALTDLRSGRFWLNVEWIALVREVYSVDEMRSGVKAVVELSGGRVCGVRETVEEIMGLVARA